MKTPRRTPYEGQHSLGNLYSLLYPAENVINFDNDDYRQQRSQGLAIVHLWLNRSACPFAVESTGSLIHAQELDEQLILRSLLPSPQSSSEWVVRSAYAMAVLRFVNSVADTFQTSMYAQSIFQISQRIGLPIWLVELRHAATHEELPSLDVLRDACIAALQWLQVHFWRPTLARRTLSRTASGMQTQTSSTTGDSSIQAAAKLQEVQMEAASELRQSLASYRRLSKSVVRDESLRGRSKTALLLAQNKVETCAKRAEAVLNQIRDSAEQEQDWDAEPDEITAAVLLVDALLEAGGLIPLSKRKRCHQNTGGADLIASLPKELLQTWLPLLNHLSASTENFCDILQEGLMTCIVHPSPTTGSSFQQTAASWLMTLFGDDKPFMVAPKLPNRQQIISELGEEEEDWHEHDRPTIVLAKKCLIRPTALSLSVARQLCAKDSELMERVKPLLEMAETTSKLDSEGRDDDQSVEKGKVSSKSVPATDLEYSILEMERRLNELQGKHSTNEAVPLEQQQTSLKARERHDRQEYICTQLPGWQVAPDDWKSTPIGCLNGAVPNLFLPE